LGFPGGFLESDAVDGETDKAGRAVDSYRGVLAD